MKWCLATLVCFLCLTTTSLRGQAPFQPFGVDAENLDVSLCNHNIGCPLIDEAAKAGAQWMRLLAIWWFIEPQQNVYNWGELPWQVWYAQQKGINIYFTATWAPQWANGASSTIPPYVGGNCGDCGRTVLSSDYTRGFFSTWRRNSTAAQLLHVLPVTRVIVIHWCNISGFGTNRTLGTTITIRSLIRIILATT